MPSYQDTLDSIGEEDPYTSTEKPAIESEKGSDTAHAVSSIDGSRDLSVGEGLQRGLNSWHLQFIAIGGAIGTGLVSSNA
jgi:amino acid permease